MAEPFQSRGSGWRPEPDLNATVLQDLEASLLELEGRICGRHVYASSRAASAAEQPDGPAALAAAAGAALAGERAAAFLQASEMLSAEGVLREAVRRHVPLVAYLRCRTRAVPGADHGTYHAAAGAGAFQIFPSTVQEALDAAVVARRLTEQALIPGLIGLDLDLVDLAVEPGLEPTAALLGAPGDPVAPPTPAQFQIFGEQRRRAPCWLDTDRPLAVGGRAGGSEGAAAAHGRQIFFWEQLPRLAGSVLDEFEAATGRRPGFLSEFATETADTIIVTQGAAVQSAIQASLAVQAGGGPRCGVVGVTWLRPFPRARLEEILNSRRPLIVLECADGPDSNAPLWAELGGRIEGGARDWWTSAVYGRCGEALSVAGLAGVIREADAGRLPRQVLIGLGGETDRLEDFPRRQALVQSALLEHPRLAEAGVRADAPAVLPPGCRALEWIASNDSLPAGRLLELAEACGDRLGPRVQACRWEAGRRLSRLRVTAGPADLPLHQAGMALDCLVLGPGSLSLRADPFEDISEQGTVVLATGHDPEALTRLIPPAWRARMRQLKLNVRVWTADRERLSEEILDGVAGGEWKSPSLDLAALQEATPSTAPVPPALQGAEIRQEYDNLSRYWGEVLQPSAEGWPASRPDPLTALGAVPAASGRLTAPRDTAAGQLPVLKAEQCTGCGVCWTICPDSAITATAVSVEQLLESSIRSCGISGKAGGLLNRSVRKVAAAVRQHLRDTGARGLDEASLKQAWLEHGPAAREVDDLDELTGRVAAAAAALQPAAAPVWFSGQAGDRLVVLSFSPDHCQGCGLCATECPETALEMGSAGAPLAAAMRDQGRLAAGLPDTPPEVAAAMAAELETGSLAASLLSRRVSQAGLGSAAADPGSGERLAVRVVSGLAVETGLSRSAELAGEAARLAADLRGLAGDSLTEGLKAVGSERLEEALKGLSGGRASLQELDARLAELDRSVTVDRRNVLRLVEQASALESLQERLNPESGRGSAVRLLVVAAGEASFRWAGRSGCHPLEVPLLAEESPQAVDLLLGAASVVAERHVEQVRTLRRAEVLLEAPPDLEERLDRIERLEQADLTAEERRRAPAMLLVTDEKTLLQGSASALRRLGECAVPLRALILGCGRPARRGAAEMLLEAAAIGAFACAGSLARPSRLAADLQRGLAFDGPAFFYIYAPEPSRHGFDPALTLQRAREAASAGVHPIFSFDPGGDGDAAAGLRLEPETAAAGRLDGSRLLEWALGEERFGGCFDPAPADAPAADWAEWLAGSGVEGGLPRFEASDGRTLVVQQPMLDEVAAWRRSWAWLLESASAAAGQEAAPSETRAAESAAGAPARAPASGPPLPLDPELAQRLRARLLEMAGFGKGGGSR